MSYSAFYRKEITEVSFNELKKMLEWINSTGVSPTIIGGWAVFAYEPGLGSRDIDIVIPNLSMNGDKYRKEYFEKNGFITRYLNYKIKTFEKTIQGMPMENIVVDVFDGDEERVDLDNLGINFDWKWMLEIRDKKTIGDLELFIPKRELLIVIKIIAALSRSKEFELFGSSRLSAKIWKDYRDIAVLSIRKSLDMSFLQEYIGKANLEAHLEDFVSKYRRDDYLDIVRDIGFSYQEIRNIFRP